MRKSLLEILVDPISKSNLTLSVTDGEVLGIKAGRYDVQRLFYWHFARLYWRETFTFEENNHVNFDWYHPRYSTRHTEEEIRRWCSESGLRITRFDETQESGFSVRAIKE